MPAREENGSWVDLNFRGEVEGGLYQAECPPGQSVKAQPGYSGSPVWNDSTGQPVGLLSAAPDPEVESERDAYLLTSLAIAHAWEEVFDYLLVPENPYRALEPFREEDAAVFFGRKVDVAELTARVDEQPVVVVVGTPGVGKTSLVQAGLIPSLPERPRWTVVMLWPRSDSWEQLAAALVSARHGRQVKPTPEESRREIAQLRTDGFGPVSQFLSGENRRLLIVLDQFEEFLATGKRSDPGLLDLLFSVPDGADTAVHLLLTLRTDFLPDLQAVLVGRTQLNEQIYHLATLKEEQLREAIEHPAKKRGVAFEDGLVDHILSDAAAGTLTRLEFTLARLWETQLQKRLSFADYHKLGRVSSTLDRYAEKVVAQLTAHLTDTNEDLVNRVLLRLVHTVADASGANRDIRKRVLQTDVSGGEWEILKYLAAARLVILDAAPMEPRHAELAHDSLITEWPRLRDLVAERVWFLTWLSGMEQRFADGKPLPDADLAEARRLLTTRPADISDVIRDYIESSATTAEKELTKLRAERDRAEGLRVAAEAELIRRAGTERAARPSRGRPTARHFARLSYAWGIGMTANRGSYLIGSAEIPADEGGYLQGSLAISCPDIGPTASYGRVFDSNFQESVADLQERNILRPGGYQFERHEEWTHSSYLVYGELIQGSFTPSFVGVEAHAYGAVSVYFKEYTKAATIDELVGWWIFNSLWMGLEVHVRLGTTGPVHVAVLFDRAGVQDMPDRVWSSPVVSLYGPFSLLPVKGDEDEEEDEWERYHWPKSAAIREIASVRAALLRESFGRRWAGDANEERDWTPGPAQDRLRTGRRPVGPAQPSRPSRQSRRKGKPWR
jgi:hypothetical protein